MAAATSTTVQHPPLPQTATMIERIALPAAFAVITASVKSPEHAAAMKEYMLAIRDAINSAYPGE